MNNFEQPNITTIKLDGNVSSAYCMIVLHGIVVFPQTNMHFDIAQPKALLALQKAANTTKQIFLVTQKNINATDLAPKDIYRVGVIATIKQIIKLPNDIMRVVVTAEERKEIDTFAAINPHFEVTLKNISAPNISNNEIEASRRRLAEAFEDYKKQDLKVSQDVINSINTNVAENFVYSLASLLYKTDAEKIQFLSEPSILKQIEECIFKIYDEIEVIQLEKEIQVKVRKRIDKQQRDYHLREQQKVISEELGDGEDEINILKEKIEAFGLKDDEKNKLLKELRKLEKATKNSMEYGMLQSYFDILCDLPWHRSHQDTVTMDEAKAILDEAHYGLDKIKTRILEFLAVSKLTNYTKSPILCFVGPPGVGKTSIVESIAKAMGRKLVTMSLGGVRDEAEIKGHRRTYIGSIPGRIINGLRQVDVNNPVFLLDEIDKMTVTNHGDPSSALLEVLDYNTNSAFKDHYIEVPVDLSKVVFITTANDLDEIPLPLLDRLEIINLSGYTFEEKFEIAKRYLIPKQQRFNGLEPTDMTIDDQTLYDLIDGYTRESGVRRLEREIGSICRKVAVKVASSIEKGEPRPVANITDLVEYLGAAKFELPKLSETNEIGKVNGLAWTQMGGKLLNIETVRIPGKGEISITGNLGKVMNESCTTALTVVKARAEKYNVPENVFKEFDFHIHFPDGATPKDGPSAGIAISLALLSVASQRPVNNTIAMTGEVSLRGQVLPIGGLKEKTLAALRNGIKTLILANANKKDLEDIPKTVQDSIEIIWVDSVDEVFERALV